jgi:hypothetical protein
VNHTNIELTFRNLSMSDYSPYTASFAGRKIDSGKLELNLKYKIDDGQLQGEHDVTLTDLVLGDKVDHPDASSLPLALAVSLLKDSNGVIDIDLPVTGDINDPEFEPGRADLTPPEMEKILNLVQVLGKRPELSLVVSGAEIRGVAS